MLDSTVKQKAKLHYQFIKGDGAVLNLKPARRKIFCVCFKDGDGGKTYNFQKQVLLLQTVL